MKAKSLFLSLLAVPLFTAGCATIVDGGAKPIQLNSNPEGAKVTISKPDGSEVLVTNTPAKITLARAAGFFQGVDYKIVFEKPGYYSHEAHVESVLDPWYIGNIFFGGIIGEVIVDPSTGDMFTLSPRKLECSLVSTETPATPAVSAKSTAAQ